MRNKLFLLIGIMALMVSCHSEFDELETSQSSLQIRLESEIGTRVADNQFCDGDQIGLYGVNYTNSNAEAGILLDEGNQVDNARYTYDGENKQWNSSGSIYYKDVNTNIDLYAYYPYGSPKSVSDYRFEVATNQAEGGATDGYANSDFLWGKAENIKPSENKVKIRFSHRLANAYVILTEGSGFTNGEFDKLEKSVLVSNTIHTASVDLATGEATPVGNPSNEGIAMRATGGDFQAIVVPQTIQGGTTLYTITIDGIAYKFKQNNNFTFQAGKQSKFTIEVSKKSMSGTYEFTLADCEIVDWITDLEVHAGEARQYYVVHLDKAGTLGEKIRADKKNPNKIKNLKVSGKICAGDFYFMRDSMEILQAVNLKESEIVSGWRCYVDLNDGRGLHFEYFGGDMPESDVEFERAVKNRYPNASDIRFDWYENCGSANEIPESAFSDKSTLVHFVFPEKVTKIGANAFTSTLLSGALIIPNDVVEIEYGAFSYTLVSSLTLSKNLIKIGDYAFNNCSYISNDIHLPESLEKIGRSCFNGCKMLTGKLIIPSKVHIIPGFCFMDCRSIYEIVLHDNITEIHEDAFARMHSLEGSNIVLPQNIQKIGAGAFQTCGFQGELVIPKYLIQIGGDDSWGQGVFSNNLFSSVVFETDSELVSIGDYAFSNNWRLSNPITLPNNITTIGEYSFLDCNALPAISIPNVTTIGQGAFANCYYLTSLQCDATIPPVVGSGAFDGVAKDNFTLQVPEDAVARYQTANGWSEFKRISANYDFSISRKHIRALNAKYSKTYLLRAPSGEPWKIENCPSWVTVTPSSGVGRTEVTITIDKMARTNDKFTREEWNNGYYETETHKGRTGEIVFLLNNKDARVKMTVEQYDYDYADGNVIVNQTASKGNGVNVVFMGDCFDARDIAMGSYKAGIDEAIGYYFGIEPYKSYKEYFNVYTVFGLSPDSGMGTVNTIREAKFGSQYSFDGIVPNTETTFEYAMKTATVNESNINKTLVVMVENTTDYGGICYMWGDGSAIAVCPMSRDAYPFDFRGIVQHEAGGHGFAKLGDEYIYSNAFIESCDCNNPHLPEFYAGKSLGWYRNLSTNGDYKTVEWAHLFANPDYSNIVDMYEGGYFHTRGIYRSEANSCMNNNVPYYSAISRQEMVERIKRYAGQEFSLAEFYAKDVRDASNNDFVTRASFEVEDTPAVRNAAAKQMPPKMMGNKPQLK